MEVYLNTKIHVLHYLSFSLLNQTTKHNLNKTFKFMLHFYPFLGTPPLVFYLLVRATFVVLPIPSAFLVSTTATVLIRQSHGLIRSIVRTGIRLKSSRPYFRLVFATVLIRQSRGLIRSIVGTEIRLESSHSYFRLLFAKYLSHSTVTIQSSGVSERAKKLQ